MENFKERFIRAGKVVGGVFLSGLMVGGRDVVQAEETDIKTMPSDPSADVIIHAQAPEQNPEPTPVPGKIETVPIAMYPADYPVVPGKEGRFVAPVGTDENKIIKDLITSKNKVIIAEVDPTKLKDTGVVVNDANELTTALRVVVADCESGIKDIYGRPTKTYCKYVLFDGSGTPVELVVSVQDGFMTTQTVDKSGNITQATKNSADVIKMLKDAATSGEIIQVDAFDPYYKDPTGVYDAVLGIARDVIDQIDAGKGIATKDYAHNGEIPAELAGYLQTGFPVMTITFFQK